MVEGSDITDFRRRDSESRLILVIPVYQIWKCLIMCGKLQSFTRILMKLQIPDSMIRNCVGLLGYGKYPEFSPRLSEV